MPTLNVSLKIYVVKKAHDLFKSTNISLLSISNIDNSAA